MKPIEIAATEASIEQRQPPATFRPQHVDTLDDDELDELEFGVISLAPDGLILRYNSAEGRLARLDPATVVGRNFFTDVAPCTYTEDFYGRFRAFVDDSSADTTSFPYVFDFQFGAQEVEVELQRVAGANRYYLFINRTHFGERRTGPGARQPAPVQAELAPLEKERGVLRDEDATRFVRAPTYVLAALTRACESLGESGAAVLRATGVGAGRRMFLDLEAASLAAHDISLRERAIGEAVGTISRALADAGWGQATFDFTRSASGAISISIDSSPLVRRSVDRQCTLLAGMLEGLISHLANRKLHVEEIRCASNGAAKCEMVVVGESRRERARALIGRPLEELIDELGGHDED